MTTSTFIRALSALIVGVSVASLAAQADPVPANSIALGAAGSLGLPDRDVVRDPYSAFMGNTGSFSVPQNIGIVGPNLGIGVGFSPGVILGGGGGGGGSSSSLGFVGGSVGTTPTVSGGSTPSIGGGGNVGFTPPPAALPSGGSSPTGTTFITQSQIVENVPEGGTSAILMGCGLLALFMLRRRLSGIKS